MSNLFILVYSFPGILGRGSSVFSWVRHTQKALRQAHWEHVNTILEDSLESGNRKPFWKYIKAKKKDNIGVAPIKDKGQLYSDSQL
jgi:hypothetical protein